MGALEAIMRLHAPIETTLEAVIDARGEREPGPFEEIAARATRCMTCQGYPTHPCATYQAAQRLHSADANDADGMETARVTVVRTLTEDGIIDYVEAVSPDGAELPLTEVLGMMRLAEDTLIRERLGDDQ